MHVYMYAYVSFYFQKETTEESLKSIQVVTFGEVNKWPGDVSRKQGWKLYFPECTLFYTFDFEIMLFCFYII